MGSCYVCDTKLFGERTRVCSSITPHSSIPYPEKIADLLGDDFVVIVTPADHMCKRCTSLLTHMDKLENDLKLVRNALVSYIQKKYGVLPPDQPVKTLDIVNGHLKTDELEVGQRKVPSGLTTVRENPVSSTPLKMIKNPESTSKLKIYKCGFCTFQSKELGHVRFHMRTHMKKDNDKSSPSVPATKATSQNSSQLQQQQQQQQQQQEYNPPQKKRLYRCQVCSASFDSRMNCLDHIQKDHNQPTVSSSNEDKETEDISTTASKPVETPKTCEGNQQTESPMEGVESTADKGTVNTDMLLNDNLPSTKETVREEKESQEIGDENNFHETAVLEDGMPPQDEPIAENSGKADDVEIKNEPENKSGDLDIESMLAAIHHDNSSPNTGNTQNLV